MLLPFPRYIRNNRLFETSEHSVVFIQKIPVFAGMTTDNCLDYRQNVTFAHH